MDIDIFMVLMYNLQMLEYEKMSIISTRKWKIERRPLTVQRRGVRMEKANEMKAAKAHE